MASPELLPQIMTYRQVGSQLRDEFAGCRHGGIAAENQFIQR
jgi:hypothetical protein